MGEPSFHWSDQSKAAKAARDRLRESFRLGFAKPKSGEVGEPERYPEEYFKCSCGSGPWHINWGGICPNCSGAD